MMILLTLKFILLNILFTFALIQEDIAKCDKEIVVWAVNSEGIQEQALICFQCWTDNVLNDNYSECIEFKVVKFGKIPHHFCKKFNNMFLCQEGIECYTLRESNHYISTTKNADCSIISDDNLNCVFPRFGLTMILPVRQFIPMRGDFCAVYNSTIQLCEKYHYRFLPLLGTERSLFFRDFFNFNQINLENSHAQHIICNKGYSLQTNNFNFPIGCQKKEMSDINCKIYDIYRNCERCEEGFVINAITNLCESSTLTGCKYQLLTDAILICLQCNKGYKLNDNNFGCIQTPNCAIYNKNPPYYCLACFYPYMGQNCENQMEIMQGVGGCELISIFNECIKCINNEEYYVEEGKFIGQTCAPRVASLNCKQKHYLSDSCDGFNIEDMIYYDGQYSKSYHSRVYPREYEALIQENNTKTSNRYGYPKELENLYRINMSKNFIAKPLTVILGCKEYSFLEDRCIRCVEGNYLWLERNFFTCRQNPPPSLKINNNLGCEIIDQEYLTCYTCREQFAYNQSTQTCQKDKLIQNCLIGTTEGYCFKCNEGYEVSKYFKACLKEGCRGKINQLNYQCTSCLKGPEISYVHIENKNSGELECVEQLDSCQTYSLEGKCIRCQDGYILDQKTQKCNFYFKQAKFCSSLQSWDPNCEIFSPQQIFVCYKCKKQQGYLHNSRCVQQCPEGFFSNSEQICQDCPANCLSCTSKTNCVKCKNNAENVLGKCLYQCKDNSYKESEQFCNQDCKLLNCSKCTQNLVKQCLTCNQGMILLSNGACVEKCPNGFYLNFEKKKCMKCNEGCISCISLNSCSVCAYSYQLIEQKCQIIQCEDALCQKCLPYQRSVCDQCKIEFVLHKGKCLQECPQGYFPNFYKNCMKCAYSCQNCLSFNHCTSCKSSYELIEGKCKGKCLDGRIVEDLNSCFSLQIICEEESCSFCSYNRKICTICKESSDVIFRGKCLPECPDGLFKNKIKNSCEKCHESCLTCSQFDQCLSCKYSFQLLQKQCLAECSNKYLVTDKQHCPFELKCKDENCITCNKYKLDDCLECKNSEDLLINGKCLPLQTECQSGYFLNTKKICEQCPLQCSSCSSYDKCTKCQSQLTSIQNNCLCKDDDSIFYQKGCVYQCPYGWIQSKKTKICEKVCKDGHILYEFLTTFGCVPIYYSYQFSRSIWMIIINEISFFIEENQSNIMRFIIKINEISQSCYSYQLIGKDKDIIIPLQFNEANSMNYFELEGNISKSDLLDEDKFVVDWANRYITLTLRIQISKNDTISMKLLFSIYFGQIYSTEIIVHNPSNFFWDPIFEEYDEGEEYDYDEEYDQDKEYSVTEFLCPTNLSCHKEIISFSKNFEFKVVQKFTDPFRSKLKLFPFHIKDNKVLQQLSYENHFHGQITYKFQIQFDTILSKISIKSGIKYYQDEADHQNDFFIKYKKEIYSIKDDIFLINPSSLCHPSQYREQNQVCVECSPQCATCLGKDLCTSCRFLNQSIKLNCSCEQSQLLNHGKCNYFCPFGQMENNEGNCERVCKEGEYLVYSKDGQMKFNCEKEEKNLSNYCQQQIERIPNLLKQYVIVDESNLAINLIIEISETPQSCYTYKLKAKQQYFLIKQIQFQHSNKLILNIIDIGELKDYYNSYLNLDLEVFYQNKIQYTIKFKLKMEAHFLLDEIIFYQNSQIDNHRYETCIERKDVEKIQQIPRQQCSKDFVCQGNNIIQQVDEEIEVIQKFTDEVKKNFIVYPHSIFLEYTHEQAQIKNQVVFLKEFSYNNTKSGQIVYKIRFLKKVNGTLYINSKVYETLYNEEEILLNQTFISQSFNLKIQKKICSIGYFYNDEDECEQCPQDCLSNKNQYQYTSCKYLNREIDNKCSCQGFMAEKLCLSQCPYGWILKEQRICKKACSERYYLNTKKAKCESKYYFNSEYCLQLIDKLPNQIIYELKKISLPLFTTKTNLILTLFEIPQKCFSFKFVNDLLKEEISFNKIIDSNDFISQLEIENFLIKESFTLSIYNENSLILYSIQIQQNLPFNNLMSLKPFKVQVLNSKTNPVCETCSLSEYQEIQQNQQVVKISIENDSICKEQDLIVFDVSKEIEILIQFTDPVISNEIIYPHSIFIEYKQCSNTTQNDQALNIKNYYYDNFQNGQIKYWFQIDQQIEGKLNIRSKIHRIERLYNGHIKSSYIFNTFTSFISNEKYESCLEYQQIKSSPDCYNQDVQIHGWTTSFILLEIMFIFIILIIFIAIKKLRKEKYYKRSIQLKIVKLPNLNPQGNIQLQQLEIQPLQQQQQQ